MKTYKYNINGNDYEVAVEGIENYVATVTVNGESYTVKMPEPEKPALPITPTVFTVLTSA